MTRLTYSYQGASYPLSIGYEPYLLGESLSLEGRAYIEDVLSRLSEVKKFASTKLLGLYNETWSEESADINPITFQSRLVLETVEVLAEPGYATFYFLGGSMFGGHHIVISLYGTEIKYAELMG